MPGITILSFVCPLISVGLCFGVARAGRKDVDDGCFINAGTLMAFIAQGAGFVASVWLGIFDSDIAHDMIAATLLFIFILRRLAKHYNPTEQRADDTGKFEYYYLLFPLQHFVFTRGTELDDAIIVLSASVSMFVITWEIQKLVFAGNNPKAMKRTVVYGVLMSAKIVIFQNIFLLRAYSPPVNYLFMAVAAGVAVHHNLKIIKWHNKAPANTPCTCTEACKKKVASVALSENDGDASAEEEKKEK